MLFGLDTANHALLHPTELGHVWENFHGSECFQDARKMFRKNYTHLLAFRLYEP